MSTTSSLDELREKEYQQRLQVNRLRRELYQQPASSQDVPEKLLEAERVLSELEQQRAKAQARDPQSNGLIVDSEKSTGLLGSKTTGLEARVYLRMAQVPTSMYHLLNPDKNPLLTCEVRNAGKSNRRVRVISFIDGYSASAVDTVDLEPYKTQEVKQLPTLFPERLQHVKELTRATLNVMLESLGENTRNLEGQVELHTTKPIWLLPKTTAYLEIRDPRTGQDEDLTRYLGAFVTPNAPDLMEFLPGVARHYQQLLSDCQADEKKLPPEEKVRLQVRAVFEALKADAKITYVSSVKAFNTEAGISIQRVRLPRESLKDGAANCLDGTILFASLLEAISLSPAVVVTTDHAIVGWETRKDSNEWRYLETTMINDSSFEDACKSAEITAATERARDPKFRFWPLRELRSRYPQILPLE